MVVKVSAMRSLGIAALGLVAGCILPQEPSLTRFEFEESHMGTPVRVKFYAPDAGMADRARRAAFSEVAAVDAAMSDWKADSELSRLNAAAGKGPVPVSPALHEVLNAAGKYALQTDGAFDVTVGPLVLLWRKSRKEGRLPSPDDLKSALLLVGHPMLVLRAGTAELKRPGMRLDLGGIAKGYACDTALAALRRLGIARAMVDAGGGMALGDPPPGQKGWRIALADTSRVLLLKNCGVATSGDWERFVEIGGVRYSHIVDPKTGLGLTNRALVTVVARNGMSADACSTAVSVLGERKGIRFAEGIDVDAWMRWRDGNVVRTTQTINFDLLLDTGP
jgi:thiamine biosynthesis lipoprotein